MRRSNLSHLETRDRHRPDVYPIRIGLEQNLDRGAIEMSFFISSFSRAPSWSSSLLSSLFSLLSSLFSLLSSLFSYSLLSLPPLSFSCPSPFSLTCTVITSGANQYGDPMSVLRRARSPSVIAAIPKSTRREKER
jgi:hypothetical protein